MKIRASLAVLASLLGAPTWVLAQVYTAPFILDGNQVTTPATGTFTNSSFNGGLGSYTVTIAPSPASGALTLTNGAQVVVVGGGSSIVTSANATITSTANDALDINGNAVTSANVINNAAAVNSSQIGLRIEGLSSVTNEITNSGTITSGTNAIDLDAPASSGSNTINNSGAIHATNGTGLNFFGDDTPINTLTNTGTINAATGINFSGNAGTLDTVTNSGTVITSGYGLEIATNNTATHFNNSGNVTATANDAIFIQAYGGAVASQFINSGTIVSTSGVGINIGASAETGGTTLTNTGMVTGDTYGIEMSAVGTGANSFTNTATVTGTGGSGISIGEQDAASNTVLNTGRVQGMTAGLTFSGDSTVGANRFTNSGTITTVSGLGLNVSGNAAGSNVFYNSGNVTSTLGGGLDFAGSAATVGNTFTNTAQVQAGGGIGLEFTGQGAGINTFSNSGQITGTTNGIEYAGDGSTINNLVNTASVNGGTNGITVTANGTGTFQLSNFGAVSGSNGAGLMATASGASHSTLLNAGAVTGTTYGIYYESSSAQNSSFTNTGTVVGTSGYGIYDFTPGDSVSTMFANSGNVTGNSNGLYLFLESSANNSATNSGVVTGQTSDGALVAAEGGGANTFTNTGTIHGAANGLNLLADGSASALVTNTGSLLGDGGDALRVEAPGTGTTSVVLAGGVETGTTHSVELIAANAPTVTILGRSSLNHDILNSGTLGTFNLNLVGVTPAEAAAIRAMNGDTSGSIATTPGYTYTWENLTLNASASSLEDGVDSGLLPAARAIDSNGLASIAYDPFYTSAAINPEAALNLLVGREIDQAIDTNEVNQGTMLAYEVNNHLDGINQSNGGFDFTGLQVSSSSMLAFAGTDSQLDSLLNLGRFGGTEMSTDTKDDGRHMAAPDARRWGAWAAGTVTLADSSTTNSTPGYQATTGSPMLGVDYRLCPDFTVGALINYSTTGADFGDGSRLGAETGLFGLYSAWHPGKWHLNTFVAGGYTSYDIDRTTFGSTANAHPSGTQAVGDATGGYDIDLGHHARFIPELGLTYTYVGVDSYTEGNAGAFDLSKGTQDIDSLRSHLGGRLTASFPAFGGCVTFIPELRASYYHEFMDDSRGVTTSLPGGAALGAFPVQTTSPERDFALVGVGLSSAFQGGGLPMAAFLNYDVQAGQDNYIAHNINAGLRVSF